MDIIGDDLRSLNAVPAGNVANEVEEACFFRVQGRTVVIRYKVREGATCFVSGPGPADHSRYESWDTLWSVLGLDSNTDTDEGLDEYLEMFPTDHKEYIKFMGEKLKEYFEPR